MFPHGRAARFVVTVGGAWDGGPLVDAKDRKNLLLAASAQDTGSLRLAGLRAGRQRVANNDSLSTPQMRDFAERLIACENGNQDCSAIATPAAFPVCEKLRPHLANLMGNTGFRALLARALARTEAELPLLRAMQVKEDGTLAASDKPEVPAAPEEFARGSVVLVAQLLSLLEAFIGEKLTLQIVADVWPRLVLNDLNLIERDTK
jgi:hypothetical protein